MTGAGPADDQMDDAAIDALADWLTEAGLAGMPETGIQAGLCERLSELGMPVARMLVIIDTLHPIHEGRLFRWDRDLHAAELREYGRTGEGENTTERWHRSPFYRLLETGQPWLRRRVDAESAREFPHVADLLDAGMTDYLALVKPFAASGSLGDMDCVYVSWTTDAAGGFQDRDIAAALRLMPALSLAIKAISLTRVAETLVETYLGRDAGRRVLSGRIARGVADPIEAVLWFSDLQNYTRITESMSPEAIIPFLNAYSDATISAIHAAGGDVLKLMGDGVLAIFRAERQDDACRAALAAAEAAARAIDALNARRSADGEPVTGMYLGLHAGTMFYGNIGSAERLDFTVVGPAVNEVSRIAALCRSVDQPILMSSAFRDALGDPEDRLVSVGRYALRGVGRPQHLYTLDRGAGA